MQNNKKYKKKKEEKERGGGGGEYINYFNRKIFWITRLLLRFLLLSFF